MYPRYIIGIYTRFRIKDDDSTVSRPIGYPIKRCRIAGILVACYDYLNNTALYNNCVIKCHPFPLIAYHNILTGAIIIMRDRVCSVYIGKYVEWRNTNCYTGNEDMRYSYNYNYNKRKYMIKNCTCEMHMNVTINHGIHSYVCEIDKNNKKMSFYIKYEPMSI